MFGENLTIAGLDGVDLSIGDRFRIGEATLEVTSHRTPCSTFASRMGDPKWVRRFFRAGRPGAYCRVIAAGSVTAGDTIAYQPFAGPRIRVSDLLAIEGQRSPDPDFMRRALETPLHLKLAEDYEARLTRFF